MTKRNSSGGAYSGKRNYSDNDRLTGSKKSRLSTSNKFNLKIDSDDMLQFSKEPFVNEKLTIKCYLYLADGSLYHGDEKPTVSVGLYEAPDSGPNPPVLLGKVIEGKSLTVTGNVINDVGEAKMVISIHKLSKDCRNKHFCLRFTVDGPAFKGTPHALTKSFKTVHYRISLTNLAHWTSTFYKDEGGRDKHVTVQAELHSIQGLVENKEIPLMLTLHYEDQTQLIDSQQKYLKVIEGGDLRIVGGKCALNFRINDVSKNHNRKPFRVKVSPTNVPAFQDCASVFTPPLTVLSKRNKPKKNPMTLPSVDGVDGGLISASKTNQGGVGGPPRLSIDAATKSQIKSGKVTTKNAVSVVVQYCAHVTMWMEEVAKRNKIFQTEWDNTVHPCIVHLLKIAKEEPTGKPVASETTAASTRMTTNVEAEPASSRRDSFHLQPHNIVSQSSLLSFDPMSSGSFGRGTSDAIAAFFGDDINGMNRLASLSSISREASFIATEGGGGAANQMTFLVPGPRVHRLHHPLFRTKIA